MEPHIYTFTMRLGDVPLIETMTIDYSRPYSIMISRGVIRPGSPMRYKRQSRRGKSRIKYS